MNSDSGLKPKQNLSECPICLIHQSLGEKSNSPTQNHVFFADNEDWVLRSAPESKNCPGYLYLEPKKHIESYSDLGDLYTSLGNWIKKGMDWIQETYRPKKIYLITVSEAVPHLHFHLVPRHSEEPKGIEYLRLALGSGFPTQNTPL